MIKRLCILIILAVVPILMTNQSAVMAACDSKCQIQGGISDGNGGNPTSSSSLDSTVKSVINLLSIVVGIVAVIMIIVAGLRYITSGGNAEKTKSAKNTLLYAAVGLVIVALSQTIAHFVLTEAANSSTAGKAGSPPPGTPPPPAGPPVIGPQNQDLPN